MVTFQINVDFPAEGIPIIQISATSFNSKTTSFSSHISPISAKLGACLVEVVKCAFQKPHLHHWQIRNLVLFSERSIIISPVLAFFTIVPTGTKIIKSSHPAHCIRLVPHFSPSSAFKNFLCLKSERVLIFDVV